MTAASNGSTSIRWGSAAATLLILTGCAPGLGDLPLPSRQITSHTITLTAVFADALNLPDDIDEPARPMLDVIDGGKK